MALPRVSEHMIVGLVLCGLLGVSGTARAQCAYQEPSITVKPIFAQPKLDTSVPMRNIKSLANDHTALGVHDVSVGLTASSLGMNSSFEVKTEGRGSNLCAQISRLNLEIGFKDTTIYLASELEPHSCGYETVLEHEWKHVTTDQQVLAAYLPQLSTLIGNALRQIGSIPTRSAEEAETMLRQVVNDYLGKLAANLASLREREQLAVDTPEEYRRISLSCDGQIQRLANMWK